MSDRGNYSLALVGAGARLSDMLTCARLYQETQDWKAVRNAVVDDNALALNKTSTAKRLITELTRRLKTLSPEEMSLFTSCIGDDQQAFIWLMCCRSYQIMRDFSEQVLAKRYQNMLPDISENIYDAFAEEQEYEHEELRGATEGTKKKVRSTIFTLMRDCHLTTRDGRITPLFPSEEFVRVVKETHPEDLNVFPKAGALL